MILPDVNVLVYAARPDLAGHPRYREWLDGVVADTRPFALSELVLSAFVRVTTNQRLFAQPRALADALAFAGALRRQPHAVVLRPGPQHWDIFADLCVSAQIVGPRVSDAYHAALAIEHDCEWVSADRHFARFPGLRWRHPLDA